MTTQQYKQLDFHFVTVELKNYLSAKPLTVTTQTNYYHQNQIKSFFMTKKRLHKTRTLTYRSHVNVTHPYTGCDDMTHTQHGVAWYIL